MANTPKSVLQKGSPTPKLQSTRPVNNGANSPKIAAPAPTAVKPTTPQPKKK